MKRASQDDGFEIVAGADWFEAAVRLGWETAPVVVVPVIVTAQGAAASDKPDRETVKPGDPS